MEEHNSPSKTVTMLGKSFTIWKDEYRFYIAWAGGGMAEPCLDFKQDSPEAAALAQMMFDAIRPVETSATPEAVLRWAEESFGPIARNRDERAARLAEEAMEVAQAEGVPLETVKRIADRIYSRPVGELGQEVGGLGITLYALAANCGLNLFGEIEREWKRVLSKPRDWWQRKHAEKVAAGTADLSPITPEEPTPRLRTGVAALVDETYVPVRNPPL